MESDKGGIDDPRLTAGFERRRAVLAIRVGLRLENMPVTITMPLTRRFDCLLAALLAAAANPVLAVQLSNNGTGQVLIFPYYTVRAGYNTLLTVSNTQNNTKAVKVRFLEARNGRQVMDFNLFLSPYDSWTGALLATASGTRIVTNDNSCVAPAALFTETRIDALGLPFADFKPYYYSSANQDSPALLSLDRTREGYVEIIEMGVIDDDTNDTNEVAGFAATVVGYIKQGATGVPANCGALDVLDGYQGNPNPTQFPNTGAMMMQAPRGGLMGRASLIQPAVGANFSFNPVALDNWSATVAYAAAGSTGPSLGLANPGTSTIPFPGGTLLATWSSGADAVSSVLMRSNIVNEFILDSGTASQSDWVLTFPTRREYVSVGSGAARSPFTNNFPADGSGACERWIPTPFNREHATYLAPPTIPVLAPPVPSIKSVACWASTVVPFGAASIVGAVSINANAPPIQDFINTATTTAGELTTPGLRGPQGPNGLLHMGFQETAHALSPVTARIVQLDGTLVTPPQVVLRGLPVIGFMLHNYRSSGVASRYGGVIEHRYGQRVDRP